MACDRFIGLCEDRRHELFIRAWLAGCGIRANRVRLTISPAAAGSAEAFVRGHYPDVVRLFRAKSKQQNLGMIVMIDGDRHTHAERKEQLAQQLRDCDMAPRSTAEQICIFAPTRNVETWTRHLALGLIVEEESDYKNDISLEHVGLAGKGFRVFDYQAQQAIASLADSERERRRIGR